MLEGFSKLHQIKTTKKSVLLSKSVDLVRFTVKFKFEETEYMHCSYQNTSYHEFATSYLLIPAIYTLIPVIHIFMTKTTCTLTK